MQPHPIRIVIRKQGRSIRWLARQLKVSENYVYRILMDPSDPASRPAPEWFYPRCEAILGVPEVMLRPADPDTREAAAA